MFDLFFKKLDPIINEIDINHILNNNQNILSHAILHQNIEMIKFLIQNRANIDLIQSEPIKAYLHTIIVNQDEIA